VIASDSGQKHGRAPKQCHCLQEPLLLFHAVCGSLQVFCKPSMLRAHCISADGSARALSADANSLRQKMCGCCKAM
jgi:hypothetical protein